jgi:hypothetical protein
MKKFILSVVFILCGLSITSAATPATPDYFITIYTSCGYAIDMVYGEEATVWDMVNDALFLEDYLCGEDEDEEECQDEIV